MLESCAGAVFLKEADEKASCQVSLRRFNLRPESFLIPHKDITDSPARLPAPRRITLHPAGSRRSQLAAKRSRARVSIVAAVRRRSDVLTAKLAEHKATESIYIASCCRCHEQ